MINKLFGKLSYFTFILLCVIAVVSSISVNFLLIRETYFEKKYGLEINITDGSCTKLTTRETITKSDSEYSYCSDVKKYQTGFLAGSFLVLTFLFLLPLLAAVSIIASVIFWKDRKVKEVVKMFKVIVILGALAICALFITPMILWLLAQLR